jgi:hypothetical protein
MDEAKLTRLTAFAGLGVFVLFIAGNLVVPLTDAPSTNAPVERLVAFIFHHRRSLLADVYLNAVGFALFLCFAAGLRQWLRERAGAGEPFSAVGLVGAVALSTLLLVSVAFVVAVAYRSDTARLDPQTTRTLWDLTFIFFALSGLPTIVCTAGFSAAILRTRALAPWVAWVGFVAAAAHVAGSLTLAHRGAFALEGRVAEIVPLFLYAWIAVVSVMLLRARAAPAPPPA